MNPTGIVIIAFERLKIQIIIVQIENNVGVSFVKPSVAFKNPFDAAPNTTAPIKNKYADSKVKLFMVYFFLANSPPSLNLQSHFCIAISTFDGFISRSLKDKYFSVTMLSDSDKILH